MAPDSRSTSHWPSRVSAPPIPVAMLTPSRSGSTSGEPGVCPGLAGGDQCELLRAVELASLDSVEYVVRVDREPMPRTSPATPTPTLV